MLVDVLAREKNVPRDIVFGALEMALASATKKKYTEDIDVRVAVDTNTGAYETFRRWKVLPDDAPDWNTAQMLSVEEAQDRGKADAKVDDIIEQPIPNVEFGRIGAQTAKQVILQRIRDAEREQILQRLPVARRRAGHRHREAHGARQRRSSNRAAWKRCCRAST